MSILLDFVKFFGLVMWALTTISIAGVTLWDMLKVIIGLGIGVEIASEFLATIRRALGEHNVRATQDQYSDAEFFWYDDNDPSYGDPFDPMDFGFDDEGVG